MLVCFLLSSFLWDVKYREWEADLGWCTVFGALVNANPSTVNLWVCIQDDTLHTLLCRLLGTHIKTGNQNNGVTVGWDSEIRMWQRLLIIHHYHFTLSF